MSTPARKPSADPAAGRRIPASSALAPLRHGSYRNLWLANILSSFGGLVQGVGAAWLMTQLTSQADIIALVQATTTLPIMLLSPLSGAIADSYDRRRVMLSAQWFMFAVSALLVIVVWTGWINEWLLLGLTFLIGCGVAINQPSWQATVGDVVPKQELPQAVLLNGAGYNVTRSVAPAIGGAIVASAGAAAAFAVNAVSYFGLILALSLWRGAPRVSRTSEPLRTAIGTGARYVALSPHLVVIMFRGLLFGLSAIAVLALLPLIAQRLLNGTAVTYGLLLGCFGIGAVIGAFNSRRLADRFTVEQLIRRTSFAFAIATLACAFSRTLWFTGPFLVLAGMAWVLSLAQLNTAVQLSTPRWVVGRALSFYQMATFGGMAGGAWLWGAITESYDVPLALAAAAGATVLTALAGLLLPLPDRLERNLDPLGRWREPELALDLKPRSGPVVIAVHYELEDNQSDAFLALMHVRKRNRSRNGARRWSLRRDLEQRTHWYEEFQFPTWADYLRFHERTTHDDAAVGQDVRALLKPGREPQVRRSLLRDPAATGTEPGIGYDA